MKDGPRPGARDSYEVVVVGGGPAGAAAALTLARASRGVLLVEAADATEFRIGETLPSAARALLADLSVWDAFAADGHLPCRGNLSAWGSPRLLEAASVYDPHGHGWHLDRARFDSLLREQARLAGADVLAAAAGKQPSRVDENVWEVILTTTTGGSSSVRCRWLLDATGRRAALARARGAECIQTDKLVAFFTLFEAPPGDDDDRPASQDSRTLVEAAPDGWWYTALLPSRRRVVAYFTDADLSAPPPDPRTAEGYLSLLERTTHVRAYTAAAGRALRTAPRGAAAHSARLDSFAGDGWLAAGDAALCFDPLSSQGILNALFTGMAAGLAVGAHLAGDHDAVARYARQLDTIHEAYLRNLSGYYSLERRWPDRPFWRRRHETRTRAGAARVNLGGNEGADFRIT